MLWLPRGLSSNIFELSSAANEKRREEVKKEAENVPAEQDISLSLALSSGQEQRWAAGYLVRAPGSPGGRWWPC